ncbi:hypothetical protein [Oceanibacterium hippocampi]|uniref:Uncharacterized protein n=1 Tax=Oceanibacterium hippocampi TaxID=745714 RepID=A0A1Y5T9S3_9PROT|nr:hypothetical protein [Oceanibacterium hippocampi]SLN58851.1 hypothetical protein OCH7691_02589 [Oceanibacterium hippocampi]
MPFFEEINTDALTVNADGADRELDLRGVGLAEALGRLQQALRGGRDDPAARLFVRIDPAGPDSGETLFQPLARYLLRMRQKGHIVRFMPVAPGDDAGFMIELGMGLDDAAGAMDKSGGEP